MSIPSPTDPEVRAAIIGYVVNVASDCDHSLDHLNLACPYVMSDRDHDTVWGMVSSYDGHDEKATSRGITPL